LDAKFEYLGEDVDAPNAKIWKVEAIHVTTTRNKRKFTKEELASSGRSLSFRPLNINHDENRQLPFPENATRGMSFNKATLAVEGSFRITDPAINAMIETGRINSVSIEQIPTLGETCNEILCEQHGVAFIGMALLESDVLPGDPHTVNKIRAESIKSLIVPSAQRECADCTDDTICHGCSHKKEFDEILEACLSRRQIDTPEMPMDMRVIECLEELNRVNQPAFRGVTIQLNEAENCVSKCLSAKKAGGIAIDDQAIAICLSECGQSSREQASYLYKVAKEKWLQPSKKN